MVLQGASVFPRCILLSFDVIFSGTDILKKKLHDVSDDNISDEIDFSHVKAVQNHNPHVRSKSMQVRKANHVDESHNPGTPLFGALLPMNEVSPDGSPLKHGNTDLNYIGSSGGLQPPTVNNVPNHSSHDRSPSLKIRRYSFLAGSRRGRGFSEIFNSAILNDHFDQYSAQNGDSGLVKDIHLGLDGPRVNHIVDPSPDSGVSESLDHDTARPLVRRLTMPSIVKEDDNTNSNTVETAHSSEDIARKNPETFVIENGIRKRVKGVEKKVKPSVSKGDLPNAFVIESQNRLTRSGIRGSLPDISVMKHTDKIKPMPRDEAFKLSMARREELRQLQELAERRRQGDVTVILGDLKVCKHCNG